MTPRTLTLAQLKGACADQRALFRELFGHSVEVTPALCVEHVGSFDWQWAAEHLLSAPALAEYERACDATWAEYGRVCDAALAEYERARAPALAEYGRVCDAALAEYERARSAAWGTAYCNDTGVAAP